MKQVLVVDDDARVAALVVRGLSATCHVRRLGATADVLSAIRRGERFDVILCRRHLGDVLWRSLRIECPDQASRVVFFKSTTFPLPPRQSPVVWN